MSQAYYTVEQISKMLSIHPKTVQRYIREGKLRANKIGKSWRVSGHDLSVFTEGTNPAPSREISDIPAEERVKASSVVDINIGSRDEAIRIVNTLTAVMNVKPPEYGRSSMHAQFLEPELKVRITLWGNIKFLSAIFSSIETLTEQNEEGI